MISAYEMAVNNVRAKIRSFTEDEIVMRPDATFNAFDAAKVLSAAFAKQPDEVLADIVVDDQQPA